jgi:hypothetical protein
VVLMLALAERGAGAWGTLAPMVGVAGLLFRWSSAPVFVILGVAVSLMVSRQFFTVTSPASDAVLTGAALGYVVAQFRLVSLTRSLLPGDPRRPLTPARPRRARLSPVVEFLFAMTIVPYALYARRRREPKVNAPSAATPRAGATAEADEVPRMLAAIAGVVAGVLLLWRLASWLPVPFSIIPAHWRLGIVVWVFIAVPFMVRVVVDYLAARRMSLLQTRLVLGDILWRETRGEARRISRFISRARAKLDSQSRSDGER